MSERETRGISVKALVVGTFGILLACSMAAHSYTLFDMGDMAGDWFPFAAAIVFLVILFGLNPVLRLIHPRLELDRVDLILVFIMVFVATPLASTAFASTFLSNVLSPLFFANTSNTWWEKLIQHMPLWLYPDDARAVAWFWEGLPPEQAAPWGAWAGPLLWWGVIFAALYALATTVVTLLRKQWVENERLIFPLMEVPQTLLEDYEKGRRIPPIMRNRLFWIGVGLPVVVFGLRIASAINSDIPSLRLFGFSVIQIVIVQTWAEFHIHLLPSVIAFAFLVKRDVLLSLWVFGLGAYIEKNVMRSVGYSLGPTIHYEDMQNAALAWQSLGGLVILVLAGLIMARAHLKDVVRKALFNDPAIDDSREVMSYRSAGAIFLLSLATLLAVFLKMGMTAGVALTLVATLLVFYIGLTRFVIEGGMVLCRPPVPALAVVIALFGAKGMPIVALGAVAACAVFANDGRTGFAPMLANSMKLTEGAPLRGRSLIVAVVYSLILGAVVCLGLTMAMCYQEGTINLTADSLRNAGTQYFGSVVYALEDTPRTDTGRLLWAGIGAAITGVLSICRYMFPWWPLHPIGFPLATGWGTELALSSIFVAWAAKTVIIRVGGAPLYTKAKPFFIGLLIGHLAAQAALYLINLIQGPPGLILSITT